MTVDPKVYALAASFIDDLIDDLPDEARMKDSLYESDAITTRLAEAMQQAIEDECEAIRQELQS